MGVSLSVLGPLALAVNGESVALRPAQRRVLATLASLGGESIDTDSLIERMWPGDPPENARTSLHVHVSGIRRATPGIIHTEGSRYTLNPEVVVDTNEFDSLIDKAGAAAAENDWDDVVDCGDKAQSIWRGDPFAELSDDASAMPEVVRLSERHLEVVELRMHALLSLGRYAEALPELRALVTDHPLHERFRYHLMMALYRGGRQVEALRTYQELRTVLGEEIGIEPDPSLRALEERILLQDPALGDPGHIATPNNLPVIATSFVGRDAAVEKIAARLGTAHLMTIVGGPGFGKTRLAIELGHSSLENYPGGVWFAGLADARSIEDVAATIASATRLQDDVTGLTDLGHALAFRRALLILDNCEHVLDACTAFATAALSAGGDLRIIATSRAPLQADGEQVWQLDPLPVPASARDEILPNEALASPAVRLFVDRAKAVDRTFGLTAESAPEIVELSKQLAGIPLAIELASRWVPALGVAEITSMLDPTVAEDADDRTHASASLRAAIDWSLALLPEEDRALVTRAAIFSGPFGLSDARAVCSEEHEGPRFAATMSRVVSSSLVQADRRHDGSVRYRMLIPIREFLLAGPTSNHEKLEKRFVRHYLSKAHRWQVDRFAAVGDLTAIDDDIENLRAALDLGLRHGMAGEVAEALVPLGNYFNQRYLSWESKAWIERTLTHDLEPSVEAATLRALGSVTEILGQLAKSEQVFERAIAIYDTLDEPEGRVRCLLSLAGVRSHRGEWAEGLATAEEAYRLVEPTGHDSAIATASYYIGETIGGSGNVAVAVHHLLDSADRFERAGELGRASYVMSKLTVLTVLTNNEIVSRSALKRATDLAATSSSDYRMVKALSASALVDATWGDERRAASTLLDARVRIEQSHPDELLDFLLPAAAVLVRSGNWELVSEILGGVRHLFSRSEEALPVPWSLTIDQWILSSSTVLGDSATDAEMRGRMTSLESLVDKALSALRHVAAASRSPSQGQQSEALS